MHPTTQTRLMHYSLMAGAITVAQKSNAQIIYTDIEPDILFKEVAPISKNKNFIFYSFKKKEVLNDSNAD